MQRTARYYRIRHNVRIAASMALVAGVAIGGALAAYGVILVLIFGVTAVAGIL